MSLIKRIKMIPRNSVDILSFKESTHLYNFMALFLQRTSSMTLASLEYFCIRFRCLYLRHTRIILMRPSKAQRIQLQVMKTH